MTYRLLLEVADDVWPAIHEDEVSTEDVEVKTNILVRDVSCMDRRKMQSPVRNSGEMYREIRERERKRSLSSDRLIERDMLYVI